jgi:hypothetical protein
VPVMVSLLVRMNHRYAREAMELEEDLPSFDASSLAHPNVVIPIEELDRKTEHAIRYAKTVRSASVHAVYLVSDPVRAGALAREWKELGVGVPLEMVSHDGDLPGAIAWYVQALPGSAEVNVVIPGPARVGRWERLRRGRTGSQIARALRGYPRVRTTLVRDHVGAGHEVLDGRSGEGRIAILPRSSHLAVVLVDKPDRAAMRAVRYAISIGATEVRAVHAAVDQENQETLIERWMTLRLPVLLVVIECWDRNVARSLERYVVEQMDDQHEVTVVLPRRDYAQLRQRILHDRTSRQIARALGRYEHVDIAVVPYHIGAPGERTPETGESTGTRDDAVPAGRLP